MDKESNSSGLKWLDGMFNEPQKVEFLRRWDIATTAPRYISILDKDIAHLEKLIENQSTRINKYTTYSLIGLLVIAIGNWFITGAFDYPEWAKFLLYFGVATYLYVLLITVPANRELLNTANKNRQRYLFEAETAGASPQSINSLCELLSLNGYDNAESRIEAQKAVIAQSIAKAVLREPSSAQLEKS